MKQDIKKATELGVYELLQEVEQNRLEGLTYIESICEYCSKRSIEVEDIVPMIPASLMVKVREEAIAKKLVKLPKTMKLH